MARFQMTYLTRTKSGRWVFRRRVPPDLRDVIGKHEWKRSLGLDESKARKAVHAEIERTDEIIRKAREGGVSEHELQRIAQAEYRSRLEGHEETLRSNPNYDPEAFEVGLDIGLEDWTRGLRDNDWSRKAEDTVADVLAFHGLHFDRHSEDFGIARRLIGRAIAAANRTALAHSRNEYGFDVGDPLFAAPPSPTARALPHVAATDGGGETLSQTLKLWIGEHNPPKRTQSEWERTVTRWKELHGDTPVASITRAQVGKFRDALSQCPARPPHDVRKLPLRKLIEATKARKLPLVSGASVNKTIAAISSLLSYAQRRGLRDDNPATGIGAVVAPKREDEERRPFTADELLKVLRASRHEKREADRWLPVLAAFTGARRNELAMAGAADVKVKDGITYLHITDAGEGRRLKNRGSRREVPLHPILIELGFLDYVRARGTKGRLFPGLRPAAYTKRFARMLDKLGLKDPALVFHSFRHGFKDACRAAGISEEVHDALTGHAGGGVGRQYGRGVPLPVLAKAISKIEYPGVTLAAVIGYGPMSTPE